MAAASAAVILPGVLLGWIRGRPQAVPEALSDR